MTSTRRQLLRTCSVALLALFTPAAIAGTVTFTPASATVNAGDVIAVDLELSWTDAPQFDNVYIVLYQDPDTNTQDVSDLTLALGQDWTDAYPSSAVADEVAANQGYPQSLTLEAHDNPTLPQMNLALGTLSIDTAGMALGTYTVDIEPGLSELNNTDEEPIQELVTGTFEFTIIPEPAALSLLALGSLMIAGRRR